MPAAPARICANSPPGDPPPLGRGSRTTATAMMTARKDTAFTANAALNEKAAMTSAASAGPMIRPKFHVAEPMATAPNRSSSGTRSGRMAC